MNIPKNKGVESFINRLPIRWYPVHCGRGFGFAYLKSFTLQLIYFQAVIRRFGADGQRFQLALFWAIVAFRNPLNMGIISIIVRTSVKASEVGKERNTPLSPKNLGKVKTAGIKNKAGRATAVIKACTALPMDIKEFVPSITKPIIGMLQKTILDACVPASISAASEVNILTTNPGMKIKTKKAQMLKMVE